MLAVAADAQNPVSPYYPDDATCCLAGTGRTLRERLVTGGFLDCGTRPCTATAKGLTQLVISYGNQAAALTGTICPEIATMTAATLLLLFNDPELWGTLPTQLGLMTALKQV